MKTSGILYFWLFIIIALCMNVGAFSQEYVEYKYDDAGNRVLRRVITISLKLSPEDSLQVMQQQLQPQDNQSVTTDKLGDCQVKIYPNPTGGAFTVEIVGTYDKGSARLAMCSLSGAELKVWENLPASNSIDIHSYPAGTYLLILKMNGSSTSWKLIKE